MGSLLLEFGENCHATKPSLLGGGIGPPRTQGTTSFGKPQLPLFKPPVVFLPQFYPPKPAPSLEGFFVVSSYGFQMV